MAIAENHQYPLDLSLRSAYEREDFLIAPSNEEAVKWIDLWPDWPAPAFILYGARASGKTHLSYVWQEKTGAVRIPIDDLADADFSALFEKTRTVIVENIDRIIGDRVSETPLFHIYNLAKEHQGHVFFTSEGAPSKLPFQLPDLRSRLCAAPAAAIHAADDFLLRSILVKLFHDKQLEVSAEVIDYLFARIERSFSYIRQLVDKIDKISLSEKRAVTIPLVKKVLEDTF